MRRALAPLLAGLAVLWLAAGPVRGGEAGSGRGLEAGQRSRLLAALWPGRLAEFAGPDLVDPAVWAETDRRAVWTRMLYETARQSPPAREPGRAAPRATPPLPEAIFDRLPGDRLGNGNSEAVVPGSSDGSGAGACPALVRGELPWPARGRRMGAGRRASPGLALATAEGEEVRAVAEGRVVFVGRLRGLGRVVIVGHGPRCHTVAACLAEVAVSEGDAVTRDMPLGRAGFCPPAGGTGVYFELRFREKALNPAEWFAASP